MLLGTGDKRKPRLFSSRAYILVGRQAGECTLQVKHEKSDSLHMYLPRARAEPDNTPGAGGTAVNHTTIPSRGHHGVVEKAENKGKVAINAEESEAEEGDRLGRRGGIFIGCSGQASLIR